jgi:hypothetical protein
VSKATRASSSISTVRYLLAREREAIRQALTGSGQGLIASEQDGLMFTQLPDADVSFIYQHHPLLEPTIEYRGVQFASPTDIGLMKLAAINLRGTRRDLFDLYSLRDIVTLGRLRRPLANILLRCPPRKRQSLGRDRDDPRTFRAVNHQGWR